MAVVTCVNCGAKNRVQEGAAQQSLQAVCGRCGAKLTVSAEETRTASAKPLKVTDASFARDVLGSGDVPVLLDCWAEWCGPCHRIAPALDELAAESQGRYVIAKLNVDENPQTAARFGVRGIPTLLIFKHGQLVERIVGVQPKQTIAARLAAHA
ncbi:MAG TPA: thioredoxin [Pyrinomonadaceae bacterium]|nr:thioredoxin [Pyrinomonadaceae bacterium]